MVGQLHLPLAYLQNSSNDAHSNNALVTAIAAAVAHGSEQSISCVETQQV